MNPTLFLCLLAVLAQLAIAAPDADYIYMQDVDQSYCRLVRYIAPGSGRWYGVNDNGCGYWNGRCDGVGSISGYASASMSFDSTATDLRSSFLSDATAQNGAQRTIKYDTLTIQGLPWEILVFATGDNQYAVEVKRSEWCSSTSMINSLTTTATVGVSNWHTSGISAIADANVTTMVTRAGLQLSGSNQGVVLNRTSATEDPWVSTTAHVVAGGGTGKLLYGEDAFDYPDHVAHISQNSGMKVYACRPPSCFYPSFDWGCWYGGLY